MNDDEFAAKDHLNKVREKLYAHRKVAYHTVRGVRLDIPSAARGLEVVAVHEFNTGGKVLGYDRAVMIANAHFHVQKAGARNVGAKGANKYPFAYIYGKILPWSGLAPYGRLVYYNPRKVHLFVDAETLRPVKSAKRVYQHGKFTYAHDLTYYEPHEVPPVPEGMNSAVRGNISATPS